MKLINKLRKTSQGVNYKNKTKQKLDYKKTNTNNLRLEVNRLYIININYRQSAKTILMSKQNKIK